MNRYRVTISLLALACPLWAAGRVDAAEYRVAQCGATTPAHEFGGGSNTPSMYVQDNCTTIAGVALHGVANAHAAAESGASWSVTAPAGTTFSHWQARFQSGAGTSEGIAVYARACDALSCSGRIDYLFFGAQENWGVPATKRWEGSGAVLLQFAMQCMTLFGGLDGCDLRKSPPGADMFVPEMTLVDQVQPSSPQLTGGNLPGPGWTSAKTAHSIAFAASDRGGGVDHVTATIGAGPSATYSAGCARAAGVYSRLAPCPTTVAASLPIDIGVLSDGVHDMTLTTVDAAGQTAASGPYPVRVDNTAPASPQSLAVIGGQEWRSHDGFVPVWENPAQQHAPIAAVRWRLCRNDGSPCQAGRRNGPVPSLEPIMVHASGAYTLQTWLEDAAGNHDAASARSVALRLDSEPPQLAFDDQDSADPLRVSVSVVDRLSGLAAGEVHLRRVGTQTWQSISTEAVGQRLIARLDDEQLEDGSYVLRATAVDGAGNESTTYQRAGGSPATRTLPVRNPTRLRAGVQSSPAGDGKRLHGRRRHRAKRHALGLRRSTQIKIGRSVTLTGVLTGHDGAAIPDATLQVYSHARYGAQDFHPVATVRTDRAGRFSYLARPRQSQILRFRYAGSPQVKGAFADVTLGVPASSTIRADDRSVSNGQSVRFQGRLRTRPVPGSGKLLEVQAYFRGRWRTFSTARTDTAGRWSFDYLFSGTVGTVLYRFRVQLPHESGYGFETGTSAVTRVVVHGPPVG